MAVRFSFKPGASVAWRGKACTILEAATASSVLLEIADTKAHEVVAVADLRPLKGADEDEPSRSLDGLAPEDLAEAKRRFAIIKPLVRCERRREEDVLKIAEANGVSRTTIYDWIKLYEGRRLMSDLAPRRKGRKMPKRLAPEVEAIITSVINECYLSKQKMTGEEVRRYQIAGAQPETTRSPFPTTGNIVIFFSRWEHPQRLSARMPIYRRSLPGRLNAAACLDRDCLSRGGQSHPLDNGPQIVTGNPLYMAERKAFCHFQ